MAYRPLGLLCWMLGRYAYRLQSSGSLNRDAPSFTKNQVKYAPRAQLTRPPFSSGLPCQGSFFTSKNWLVVMVKASPHMSWSFMAEYGEVAVAVFHPLSCRSRRLAHHPHSQRASALTNCPLAQEDLFRVELIVQACFKVALAYVSSKEKIALLVILQFAVSPPNFLSGVTQLPRFVDHHTGQWPASIQIWWPSELLQLCCGRRRMRYQVAATDATSAAAAWL
jgi:hypothetical protein